MRLAPSVQAVSKPSPSEALGVDEELVEASADGGELEPVADLVAEVGGGGGEAQGAVLGTGGVDGGERLDGADDCRDHAFGRGEGEGFVGEVFGAGVVAVGGGEDRFEASQTVGWSSSTSPPLSRA